MWLLLGCKDWRVCVIWGQDLLRDGIEEETVDGESVALLLGSVVGGVVVGLAVAEYRSDGDVEVRHSEAVVGYCNGGVDIGGIVDIPPVEHVVGIRLGGQRDYCAR